MSVYEGYIEIKEDNVNIRMKSNDISDPEYDIHMHKEPKIITKFMSIIKPFHSPDEPIETPQSYTHNLMKHGFSTFYADSPNIKDLLNIYATTPPKEESPFPGIDTSHPRNEIIVTETIHNFSGKLNNYFIENKTIQFRYKGAF